MKYRTSLDERCFMVWLVACSRNKSHGVSSTFIPLSYSLVIYLDFISASRRFIKFSYVCRLSFMFLKEVHVLGGNFPMPSPTPDFRRATRRTTHFSMGQIDFSAESRCSSREDTKQICNTCKVIWLLHVFDRKGCISIERLNICR